MVLDDYRDDWDSQPCDAIVSRVQTVVHQHVRRHRRTTVTMLAMLTLNVVATLHFFWASYFMRGEGVWIALVRCSLFLVVAGVQVVAWRRLRREGVNRQACVHNQRQCLTSLLTELNREIRRSRPAFAIVPLTLVIALIVALKWIDFRLGHDGAAECIAIASFSAVIIAVIPIGMWHYQQQFLIPRRDHIRSVLKSLGNG